MDKVALIDADSLSFICSKIDKTESIQLLDQFIFDIVMAVEADYYVLFMSDGPYFRHEISSDYKHRRRDKKSDLLWLEDLDNHMLTKHKAVYMPGVEADDLVVYWKTQFSKETDLGYVPIICSGDKDVLRQVHGQHFNYRKNEWVNVSEEEAKRFLYFQCISGDATDCIPGIFGIGPKGAEKILDQKMSPEAAALNAYIENYKSEAEGIYNFCKNFRLVYLLRTDVDFKRELGTTPNPIDLLPAIIG